VGSLQSESCNMLDKDHQANGRSAQQRNGVFCLVRVMQQKGTVFPVRPVRSSHKSKVLFDRVLLRKDSHLQWCRVNQFRVSFLEKVGVGKLVRNCCGRGMGTVWEPTGKGMSML
jgi:hypothetical protein